jgi:hypothetical protein
MKKILFILILPLLFNIKAYADNTAVVGYDVRVKDSYGNIINPPTEEILSNLVSVSNSTFANLTANEAFTGEWEDISQYAAISFMTISDQDSVTDGINFQWSVDGAVVDHQQTATALADTTLTRQLMMEGRYFRITYTNGVIDQTSFKLQTILMKTPSIGEVQQLSVDLDDAGDAQLVRSVIAAKTPAGPYQNVNATNGGNLKGSMEEADIAFFSATPLPVTDPYLEISQGKLTGVNSENKFGRAVDGIQTSLTDIWDRADAAATQQIWLAPTAPRVHSFVSDSTNDDGGDLGTGAHTLRYYGLQNWSSVETNEDVVLNGLTSVSGINPYVIIHRMEVTASGASGPNAGTITATAATDATVTAQINAGIGKTNMSPYGIPSTQIAYMTNWELASHNTGSPASPVETDFFLLVNSFPNIQPAVFINEGNKGMIATGSSDGTRTYRPYKKILGPAIIKFQATATTADTEGTAEYDIILVDN